MCVCVTFCFLSIVRQCRLAFLLLFSCLTVIYFPPSPFRTLREISHFSIVCCSYFLFILFFMFCAFLKKTFKNICFHFLQRNLPFLGIEGRNNEYIIEVCVIRAIIYVTIYTTTYKNYHIFIYRLMISYILVNIQGRKK